MGLRDAAYTAHTPIRHVYFPLSGIFSIVTAPDKATPLEVATIGNGGFVGPPVFQGATTSPLTTFSQMVGASLRLDAAGFRALVGPDTRLHARLQRFAQALFLFAAQAGACRRLHPVAPRCARWLLLTHDRVARDTFPLTHEFLAQTLGVRRASVSEVAGCLRAAGLITYRHGIVTIRNRPGLEAAACACYRVIKDEYDRLPDDRAAP